MLTYYFFSKGYLVYVLLRSYSTLFDFGMSIAKTAKI